MRRPGQARIRAHRFPGSAPVSLPGNFNRPALAGGPTAGDLLAFYPLPPETKIANSVKTKDVEQFQFFARQQFTDFDHPAHCFMDCRAFHQPRTAGNFTVK
jgi:hypothetical protein